MKRLFVLGSLLACLALGSCQCSDKPEIGPVEDAAASVVVPDAAVAWL